MLANLAIEIGTWVQNYAGCANVVDACARIGEANSSLTVT